MKLETKQRVCKSLLNVGEEDKNTGILRIRKWYRKIKNIFLHATSSI